MSDQDQFVFNFQVGEETVKNKKITVRGKTVRERAKERKNIKHLKSAEKSIARKTVAETLPTGENSEKNTAKSPQLKSSFKSRTAVTSSLFTKNPDVPNLKSSDVTQIVEEVFSDQKFTSIPDLHPHMVANLETRLCVQTMTAIQHKTIPAILHNARDILVQSQTGSGKTLAYAIPIVNSLQADRPKLLRHDGTFAVIVVPTRELAVQSYECLVKLVYPFQWVVPGCFMGGEKRKAEKVRLRKGVSILVATPGRLLDHLQRTENLNLARLRWLVIDEADRLLDLGYEKAVQEIVERISEKSQRKHHTILLSATLSKGVDRLAGMSLADPLRLYLNDTSAISETDRETFAIPEHLAQHYTIVPLKLRLVTLSAFILDKFMKSNRSGKIIVFLSTHVSVDFHHDLFTSVVCSDDDDVSGDLDIFCRLDGAHVYKLHGEMNQVDRTKTFQDFVSAKSGVLFCTDVAARGLHLPRVDWIVQYTAAPSVAEYIHRVGRTARAGKKGQSLMFLLPSEADYVKLLNERQISIEQVDMHKILQRLILTDNIQKHSKKPLNNQTITQNATGLQNAFEKYVMSDKSRTELAGRACLSYIRAYSTYPKDVKTIFHIKNLHLGHVAKSFALRQAPSGLGSQFGARLDTSNKLVEKSRPAKRKFVSAQVSEFSSGIESGRGKKRKKQPGAYDSDNN